MELNPSITFLSTSIKKERWIKRFFKILFFPVAQILVLPLILLSNLETYFNREGCFHMGGHICSFIPGTFGNLLRVTYAMGTLKKCHHSAYIGFGTYFSQRNTIVEKNVGMGAYCIIGECYLKENTKLGSRVSILSGLNEHGKTQDFLEGKVSNNSQQIPIGPNSWIGEASVVGAPIGRNTVVSMGAIVFKEVIDNRMAMGNPARSLPLGQ